MMKRCKNCRLWRPFQGDEPTMPKTKSHACVLRLHEVKGKNEDGEEITILRPSISPDDPKGPHHGKRTNPNFVCAYFAAKHKPYVKPKEPAAA